MRQPVVLRHGGAHRCGRALRSGAYRQMWRPRAMCWPAGHVSDISQAQALLHGDEAMAFGDAGYQGVEKREEHLETPVTWHLAMRPGKRRALDKSPEGEQQEWLEQAKASIRAKVEHPFHVVKNLFRHRKTRYRGLAKNAAQLFSLFGLANLMLARRWLLNPQGQVAS